MLSEASRTIERGGRMALNPVQECQKHLNVRRSSEFETSESEEKWSKTRACSSSLIGRDFQQCKQVRSSCAMLSLARILRRK